jgi:hypothetical protein
VKEVLPVRDASLREHPPMRVWPIAVIVVALLGIGLAVYLYNRDSDTINCQRVPQSSPLSMQPCVSTSTSR